MDCEEQIEILKEEIEQIGIEDIFTILEIKDDREIEMLGDNGAGIFVKGPGYIFVTFVPKLDD